MVEFELDVESHLDAVDRSVSWLERDGMDASEVTLARDYATTVEDLWDAVTNAERIPRWFAPSQRRTAARRQLSGGRQRRGQDHGVRAKLTLLARLGVWRVDELGGRKRLGRGTGPRAAQPHAHGAPFGVLGHLRAGGGRSRLGNGVRGTWAVPGGPQLAQA